MNRVLFLLPLLAALGACLTADEQASAADQTAQSRIPAAIPDGAPENCVNLQDIRESRVLSDDVIDFHMRNGKVLRNTLPQGCSGLGFERAFAHETSINRLCNVDIITVLNQGGGPRLGASCGLGMFQPVKIEKK